MTTRKTFKTGLSGILLIITFLVNAQAQNTASVDSTKKYLEYLFTLKPADTVLISNELSKLVASKNEKKMTLALRYFYRLKDAKMADSIIKMELKLFPDGEQARNAAEDPIYKAKTTTEMETLYWKWLKKYPPAKFDNGEVDGRLRYDYVRSGIANRYAKEKNAKKAIEFADMMEADFWKGNAYGGLSEAFYKTGDLANAEKYAKKAMASAYEYTDGKKGNSSAAQFAASGYAGLTGTYANILFEEKKYAEALIYSEIAYKGSKELNPRINGRYAEILMALNRNQEAFDRLDEVIKAGKATPEMAENFKKLYIKIKGTDSGFDEYAAAIKKGVTENLTKRLNKDIVNEPAAIFTLTDLKGNKVSLESLKGKVVILDFWATWCAPCKASFPAMQMAVSKYKNDPMVQFLFIHTWERSSTPTEDARSYIESMKYNFEVLMDTKDANTKENKVVSSYKVYGIPAKFVIDKLGNIRFKLTGFDGSNEAAVEELSMMIDMAKSKS